VCGFFRAELQNDVRILAGLEDQNIARVLCVCTVEQPLCVVMEYSEHGDLNQFLKSHTSIEAARNLPSPAKTLRYVSVSNRNDSDKTTATLVFISRFLCFRRKSLVPYNRVLILLFFLFEQRAIMHVKIVDDDYETLCQTINNYYQYYSVFIPELLKCMFKESRLATLLTSKP